MRVLAMLDRVARGDCLEHWVSIFFLPFSCSLLFFPSV